MLWFIVSAYAADPVLHAPAAPVPAGREVSVELVESAAGSLFISGCGAVELERRWGTEWRPEPVADCGAEVPAVEVVKRTTLSLTVDDPGIYRVRVAWGTGCAAGWSFVRAGCRRVGEATSDAFEVVQSSP